MSLTKTLMRVVKRNGSEESFNAYKITAAIRKAGEAAGEFDEVVAQKLTLRVINLLHQLDSDSPAVENIQDIVEDVLLTSPFRKKFLIWLRILFLFISQSCKFF